MVKRSRLRRGGSIRGRVIIAVVLAGLALVMGRWFFSADDATKDSAGAGKKEQGEVSPFDGRGTIYDRNFKEMAVTLDRVSVYADIREVDREEVATVLSEILEESKSSLKNKLEEEKYRAWLAKDISQQEEEAILAANLNGVKLHRERVRFYPEMQTAAHVIGYVGKSMGLSGVEYTYNELLGKFHGSSQQRDTTQVEEGEAQDPFLVLTIDLKIQKILDDYVKQAAAGKSGARVAAMFMECHSGKIIGSAQYPSFNPHDFKDFSRLELENILALPTRIPEKIRGFLHSGSLLQAAHEKGNNEVLPWSVNGVRVGLGSQLRLWDRLGFNDPVSFDFVHNTQEEYADVLGRVESWETNGYQGVPSVASPIQVLSAVNNMLMGGKVIYPHVINTVAGENLPLLQEYKSSEDHSVDREVAGEIQHLLSSQLTKGPIASGSLEAESIYWINQPKGRKYYRNKMLFYVVPQSQPQLVLFVFALFPPYTLSPSAAETKSRFDLTRSAGKIIIPMVALQEVRSNLSDMMTIKEKNEMNYEITREEKSPVVGVQVPAEKKIGKMPDLKGLSLRKSLRMLKDLKLEIQISGTGVVVEQHPPANTQVKEGELCRLLLKPH